MCSIIIAQAQAQCIYTHEILIHAWNPVYTRRERKISFLHNKHIAPTNMIFKENNCLLIHTWNSVHISRERQKRLFYAINTLHQHTWFLKKISFLGKLISTKLYIYIYAYVCIHTRNKVFVSIFQACKGSGWKGMKTAKMNSCSVQS